MKLSTVFLGAAALVAVATSAHARQFSSWTIGAWDVAAYTDEKTGAFSHCVASVPYRSGITLAFSIDAGGNSWRMALTNSAWNLPAGKQYPISYTIDGRIPATDNANVLDATTIVVELPANSDLFQLFQTGSRLTVGAAGDTFPFDLRKSQRVLDFTLKCSRNYTNTASPTNPFERGGSPTNPFDNNSSSTATSADYKTEATTVLANVLAASGVQGFTITADMPDSLREYHAAWTAPGVLGGVRVQEANVPDAVAYLISADEKSCKGTFASVREHDEKGIVSVKSGCRDSGNDTEISYTVAPRSAGGTYVFFTYVMPNSAPGAGSTGTQDAAGSSSGNVPQTDTLETAGNQMFQGTLKTLAGQ